MTVRFNLATPLERDPLTAVTVSGLSLSEDGSALLITVQTPDGADQLHVALTPGQRSAVRDLVGAALTAEYGAGTFEVTT